MPVYLFECDTCGKQFEVQRSFGAPDPTTCPAGHAEIHRVFVPPTIIFKGSGFYSTDHGKNGLISRSTSKDESSSESKPEAQTETQTGDTT